MNGRLTDVSVWCPDPQPVDKTVLFPTLASYQVLGTNLASNAPEPMPPRTIQERNPSTDPVWDGGARVAATPSCWPR